MNINIDAEKEMAFVTNKRNIGNCEECPYNVGADERQKVYACGQLFCWINSFAKKMTDWISVENDLPEDLEDVLVTCVDVWNRKYVETAYLDTDTSTWVISGWSSPYPKVTAWQPLPEPYKEATK